MCKKCTPFRTLKDKIKYAFKDSLLFVGGPAGI